MLSFDLAATIREIALILPGFLLAITCHEAAHGFAAYLLGDPTAKQAGRLTLNPLKHLDLMGTLLLVLTRMIGWAKPVPVDARYFRNPARGMMLVALAGPAANMLVAVLLAGLFRLSASILVSGVSPTMQSVLYPLALICKQGALISLVLGCFNLLPIPPLDGSKILAWLLPLNMAYKFLRFERYGFIIIILLAATGLLGKLLWPMVQFVGNILL